MHLVNKRLGCSTPTAQEQGGEVAEAWLHALQLAQVAFDR